MNVLERLDLVDAAILRPTKKPMLKRYLVTFKGLRTFHNVETPAGALAMARVSHIAAFSRAGQTPDAALANADEFAKVAGVKHSERY